MKVKIPFYERFREPMVNDVKTWTSRTKRYGNIGDIFDIFEHSFEILEITTMTLEQVAEHWREEGCNSKDDFIKVWHRIHRRKGFVPKQHIYVHIFRRIN